MNVRERQVALYRLGFDCKGIDGIEGPNTLAAYEAFKEIWGSDLDSALQTALRSVPPFIEARNLTRANRPTSSPIDLIVIHTMDIDSLFARVMGQRWPWLMEMHIYYFSHRTLSAMLTKAGFQVLRAEPQGRYLRLGYFATRVSGFSPFLGRKLARIFQTLRLSGQAIPLNFGDLFTAYALKS